MTHDIRYALRALSKAPFLTAALVVSLGMGIGANAAVFNLISTLMLRPPPGIANPAQLVSIHTSRSNGSALGLTSHPDLESLRSEAPSIAAAAGYDDSLTASVRFEGELQHARIAAVTSGFFATLGMQAARGRLLAAGDTNAAVISHTLFDTFGGDPAIAGKTIGVEGRALTIAGVAPPRFRGLYLGRVTDVWMLLPEDASLVDRGTRRLSVVARVDDRARATADATTLATALATRFPATNKGTVTDPEEARRFTIDRYSYLDPALAAETRMLTVVLMGATLLVLACAFVNAASLLLSRGNARRRDFAVKLALGASRRALALQILLESASVGLLGGCAGLLFAYWTSTIVPSLFAPEHAAMMDARLSAAIAAATLAGAALAGIALGVLPAIYGSAPATLLDLRGDAGSISETGRGARVQLRLVVAQIAISTVLLVSALLLERSLREALEGDLGFGARTVAVATLSEPPWSFDPARGMPAYRQAVAQALTIPGVANAGLVSVLPLAPAPRATFGFETKPGVIERAEMEVNVISRSYLSAMQTPIIGGRAFRDADSARAPLVALVSEIAVSHYFGGSAVGRRLIDARGDAIEIVGVVRSGRYRTMQEAPAPMVYRPLEQVYLPRMHVVMRTRENPGEMLDALRPAMNAGHMELQRLTSLDTHLGETLVMDRFARTLVAACGLMALLLALAGAYGLMLDSVQRRTREIGLRLALGASALDVGRSILLLGLRLTATGIAVGFAATLAAWRLAQSLMFGLPPVDIATLAVTACVLLLVVSLAAVIPVRRALRVSPTVALRA
ncbi:MAG: ABC transporter permease [Acidobacteriota bacterium]|nr:ABC transporter permease [Acidobacteriota bacterium]